VAGLAATFGSGAMTNSIREIEDADCIFVIGSNTIEQHPLVARYVMRAKEKGAKLIVSDIRHVPLARFADLHLRQRPGTNVALANGMMHVILAESLEDREFIAERTEGFEALEAIVRGYTPERVEAITGVPRDKIVEAARMYGKAECGTILYAMGITQHTTGTDNVKSLANLAMITGNVGRPSTGVNPLRGQNNVQGACDMGALPNVFSGYQAVTDEASRKKFEDAWQTVLPSKPGLTLSDMMSEAARGSLKAMYIMGENPMLADPDLNHVRAVLEQLEFLVVQDIFLTETAELAHVVLPAASFAEKDGTVTSTERRVQLMHKAVEPVGQSKADWQIICEIARAAGSSQFDYPSPAAIMQEIARLTPSYGGITYERLGCEGLQWPCPSQDHPGTPYLHKGKFTRGKGQLMAIEYKASAELPDDAYPLLLTTGRTMFHFHTGTMTRRTAILNQEVATGWIEVSPQDAASSGIENGEMITVASRRGTVNVTARVTNRIGAGVVFMPFHFAECAANILTNPALDPIGKIPEFKVSAVRLQRLAP
jgi:formate dehydrogenase alpha subunit